MGIRPMMFWLAPEKDFRFLAMKVQGSEAQEVESEIRTWWKDIGPDDPYRGILQDDVFSNFKRNSRSDMNIIGSVAVITLILACLGLYGLVAYNITRRLKEFSVRKVFGANSLQIFRLMNSDYVWILSIAFVLGAPAGFLLMRLLITTIYPDPQPAGVLPFAIAVCMMFFTVALTVGLQMRRVVRENPANTLRSE
jgi:putative ABC transport system permease protein